MIRPCEGYVASTECAYCFLNKFNRNGLYLCMHCNFCTCLDHVNIHQEKTGHTHYLHIQYTLKHKEKNITARDRVDILLRGKHDDIFTLDTKIYLFPGRQAMLSVPEDIMDCYFFLIESEDNPDRTLLRKQPGVAAPSSSNLPCIYDQLASSCEHVVEALTAQPHALRGKNKCFSSCASCDISNNLWLCLLCGHVGCGRSQAYSELSGNGHALSHYYAHNNHCVALKLSSLSSSVCEVYCYKCDISVDAIFTVPDMRSMLQNYLNTFFGHDVASLMSRAEGTSLSLEQQEERIDELVDRYGLAKSMQSNQISLLGVLSGFRNTGNTCYASVVISCLRASGFLPKKSVALEADALNHYRTCNVSDPIDCPICQQYRLYAWGYRIINYRVTDISAHGYLTSELPYFIMYSDPHLTPLIRLLTPDFTTNENIGFQHDAAEYLNSLLNFFRENNPDLIKKVSLPTLRREIRCTSCRGHVYKPEVCQEWGISLTCSLFDTVIDCEVGPEISMQSSLQSEFGGYANIVDDLHCPLCSAVNVRDMPPKVLLSSSYIVKTENDLPEILIVTAMRQYFDVSTMRSYKLLTRLIDSDEIKANFLVSTCTEEDEEKYNTYAWENALKAVQSGSTSQQSRKNQGINMDDQLSTMMDMLIADRETCMRALKQCNGDIRLAVDTVLNNEVLDDDQYAAHKSPTTAQSPPPAPILTAEKIEEALHNLRKEKEIDSQMNAAGVSYAEKDSMSLNYKLAAFIMHRGTQLDNGHYLSYVRASLLSDEDLAEMHLTIPISDKDWLVFNDEEVTLTQDPPIQMAYIYVYRRMPKR